MSTETIRYRLGLSNALHGVSPALSALHTSRAIALHPELAPILLPSHCPKCGTYRFSAHHPANLPPKKKRKPTSSSRSGSFQRRCHTCGFSGDGAACASASPNDSSQLLRDPPYVPSTDDAGQLSRSADNPRQATPDPSCAPQSTFKPSRTKKSTLKDMLSRNRQREADVKAHSAKKEDQGGLGAFLKEL